MDMLYYIVVTCRWLSLLDWICFIVDFAEQTVFEKPVLPRGDIPLRLFQFTSDGTDGHLCAVVKHTTVGMDSYRD